MQSPSHFVCAGQDFRQNSKDDDDHCSACKNLHSHPNDYPGGYVDLPANAGFYDDQHFNHCQRRGDNDAEHDHHNDRNRHQHHQRSTGDRVRSMQARQLRKYTKYRPSFLPSSPPIEKQSLTPTLSSDRCPKPKRIASGHSCQRLQHCVRVLRGVRAAARLRVLSVLLIPGLPSGRQLPGNVHGYVRCGSERGPIYRVEWL
jgi:hypothetical protein